MTRYPLTFFRLPCFYPNVRKVQSVAYRPQPARVEYVEYALDAADGRMHAKLLAMETVGKSALCIEIVESRARFDSIDSIDDVR